MSTFTINFVNNSSSPGDFCIFQQNPNSQGSRVFSLAWRVERAAPRTQLAISWNIDPYFFWAKTGELERGVVFNAGGNARTSMTEDNEITLTKRDRDYIFKDQKNWYQQGALSIQTDGTTVPGQASVGIGWSGAVAYAVQAQPMMRYVFSPRFDYWVAFGSFQQGEVLNPSELGAVKVEFPQGIFSMNATLNADNSWTIKRGLD